MEKRRHPRMTVNNLTVDVSDGKGFFSGNIGDLSRFGFSMTDLPIKMDSTVKRISAVISGNGKNFKLQARPRWVNAGGYRKDIGVEIIRAPYGWTEYIMKLEPKHDDIWGSVRL